MAENIVIAEMTWTEVEAALKDRPVGLLPVGSTQAHGPHLPIATDSVIASQMARAGAAKLKARGIPSLILPPFVYTVADMGADFPGTISVGAEAAGALIRDVCVAAAKRLRAVALVNLHMEPAHLECLRKATEEARKAGASVCFTDLSKKRWSDRLGEGFLAGEHGGSFDTSLMLAAARETVREKTRISLPPTERLTAAQKKDAKTLLEAGGEDGYLGDPTAASVEEGTAAFNALADILALSVMEHLGSKA
jgi:creatinine amidohydrolase